MVLTPLTGPMELIRRRMAFLQEIDRESLRRPQLPENPIANDAMRIVYPKFSSI
jgi:hypothetical protein